MFSGDGSSSSLRQIPSAIVLERLLRSVDEIDSRKLTRTKATQCLIQGTCPYLNHGMCDEVVDKTGEQATGFCVSDPADCAS